MGVMIHNENLSYTAGGSTFTASALLDVEDGEIVLHIDMRGMPRLDIVWSGCANLTPRRPSDDRLGDWRFTPGTQSVYAEDWRFTLRVDGWEWERVEEAIGFFNLEPMFGPSDERRVSEALRELRDAIADSYSGPVRSALNYAYQQILAMHDDGDYAAVLSALELDD